MFGVWSLCKAVSQKKKVRNLDPMDTNSMQHTAQKMAVTLTWAKLTTVLGYLVLKVGDLVFTCITRAMSDSDIFLLS